jgi:N-acetylglutamate synthase-like GNAT family acetyltransferase
LRKTYENYYTAAEAMQVLGVTDGMFYNIIRNGDLEGVKLPGRKQSLYEKARVNQLARELKVFMASRKSASAVFEKATTKQEILESSKLSDAIFGGHIDIERQLAWLSKNPDICYVVKSEWKVVGYAIILPLQAEKIEKIIREEEFTVNLEPDEIGVFKAGETIHLYMAAIGVIPGVTMVEKRMYGSRLISGLMDVIIDLGRRGVIIKTIFARSSKPDGISLLRKIGFTELLSTTEKKNFMIDVEKSGIKEIVEYKQALQDSGVYTFPQTLSELATLIFTDTPPPLAHGIREEYATTFSKAAREGIPACVELSKKTFPDLQQGIASVETRLAWLEKNPDLFYVVKRDDEVVGYTAIIPMKPEKIQKILVNEEFIKDVQPEEIQEFQPGPPLHIYAMTMITKPNISKGKKRAYGSSLVAGLITAITELGKKGVTIHTIYGRSETVDGIRALKRIGFTQIPSVTTMQNFALKMDESDAPLFREYKRALSDFPHK